MIEAKPRCKWRGHHIAWCRKYGKFCDAPREYEFCPGYEPRRLYQETLPFAKVSHNIRVLRNQILPVGTKFEGVTAEEITESTRRFMRHFFRARGLLPENPVAAQEEIRGAIKELETIKQVLTSEDYQHVKTMLSEIETFLGKHEIESAIAKMEALWIWMMTKAFPPPPYIASPFPVETKESPNLLQCPRCGKGPVYEAYFMSSPVVWCWNCGALYNFRTGEVYGENRRTGSPEDYSKNREIVEGRKRSPQAFPETLRLKPLFDLQTSLIEHKFPHEHTMVMDNVISCAGDIYREMTHAYPDYSYVGEKWEKLTAWSAKPPLSWLQAGDWVEIRNELQNPSYKALRDQYLSNLQRLREETVKMPMDPKRSVVMTESLDMIKALIPWFESLDPYAPPKWQLDRLTDAIYNYFPREFFKSSWVQIPPETDMLYIYDKHPSYTSMYNISVSSTLELKNQFGPELKQMISEAEAQKREIGAMLCRTAAGQPHLSRACYGRRETVTVTDCHDGLSPLGSFHVHLGGTDVFSVPDLELAIKKEQLSCLGYTKGGHHYLKCVMPKRYYELPYETRTSIGRSLDQARQDIERANQLFRASPSNPEAQALSQRAKATLRNIESHLEAYEVPL